MLNKSSAFSQSPRSDSLTRQTVAVLQSWVKELPLGKEQILFPNNRGGRLSNVGSYLLKRHVAIANEACPSLRNKHVTPHSLRHSAAMELVQAGVDTTVIALWLGHESIETTHIYLEADSAMKEKALAMTKPHEGCSGTYKPGDALLAFLKAL